MQATRVQHKCNKDATRTTQAQHECYTSNANEKQVKNVDFDNGTSKNIFSQTYIYYMASKKLLGEEQFLSKDCLLEMSFFQPKMRLKIAPQKLNFLMAKAISKSCTLDCSCVHPCTFLHRYAQ